MQQEISRLADGEQAMSSKGNISEMILYDRALDLDEQQRVENYLRDKWGTMPLGRVKQWTDKSGLGNNAVSYAPSYSPSNF